jgi:hypothetical protein
MNAVVHESRDLPNYFLKEELGMSRRLNISYEGVRNKFLIANDLDSSVKRDIRSSNASYEYTIDSLPDGYSRLNIILKEKNYRHAFYVKGNKAISALYYYTHSWNRVETKHFRFLLSDSTLFNKTSANRLEQFLESMFTLLHFTRQERKLLEKEKIIYILCKDQNDIEQVTGFKTLGMYIVAFDEIVTTYNCHYHELLHLLINYKLKHLPLYTHPLLQEGFAVAYGGRGGKEPGIILDAGYFLVKSEILDYPSLLIRSDFLKQDASVSYPVSGLYNLFLMKTLGAKKYLEVYRNCSTTEHNIDGITINERTLPSAGKWQTFINTYAQHPGISLNVSTENTEQIFRSAAANIFENETSYSFWMKDTVCFAPNVPERPYKSSRFAELASGRPYHGEKYMIIANEQEISVYNLYTNNVIANIVGPFSVPPMEIPKKDGWFEFSVKKNLFEEQLDDLLIY